MTEKEARNSHVLTADLFSSPVEVDSFCREAREFLAGNGLSSEIFPIELLLRESLNNAIFHGNCSDCRKKVQIVIMIGRKWIKIRVADEGPGFNFRKARRAIPDEESVCERGMAIFSIYADRISFNAKGNSICLWRRRLQEQDCE